MIFVDFVFAIELVIAKIALHDLDLLFEGKHLKILYLRNDKS